MSKRQSTIKSFFHNLEDSRKRSHSTENTDEKTSVYDKEEIQTPSNTENECPNNTLTGNQLPGRDKKLKLEDKNRENNDKTSSPTHLMTEHSIDSDSSEQQTIFCNNFKGALNANIGISWFDALEKEFDKPYFKKLNDFLQQERKNYTIFPPHDEVWSWTHHFNVKETRVVIIGQDPYHGPMQAHGICFSVKHGVKPPPSLINMYKELERDDDVKFSRPNHGFLEGWSKQGVLLLNAVLTVRSGQANSHKDRGWEKITDAVIRIVSEKSEKPVVFLLWGAYAQKKAASVEKRHHLLKSVHPSPLSAHRGFIGCSHFSTCNKILVKEGREPIDWSNL